MNYPPPPPLPMGGGPPSIPPPSSLFHYNNTDTDTNNNNRAPHSQLPLQQHLSGLSLQHPSQVETIPHYGGGYGGLSINQYSSISPKSQNNQFQIHSNNNNERHTPASATSATSGGGSRKKVSNRISPQQLPRPDKPQTDLIYNTRSGTGRRNPPVVNSLYVSVDTGNANPRFLRSTLVAPPTTPDLLKNTSLPFSLHVTPFASLAPGEEAIPVINYEQQLPPRCKRCSGYISPFVSWMEQGNKWQCALCQTINVTPEWYVSALDGANQRIDRSMRPELTRGTVDYVLPMSLFNSEPTKDNILVFAIDISYDAVQQGFTLASLRAIKSVLRNLHQDYQYRLKRAKQQQQLLSQSQQNHVFVRPGQPLSSSQPTSGIPDKYQATDITIEDCQIGILTFHNQLQFYDVRLPTNGHNDTMGLDPVHVMMGDVDDPFCPLPLQRWLHRFSDATSVAKIFTLLDKLPELLMKLSLSTGVLPAYDPHQCRRYVAPAAAIVAVEESLREAGGRMFVFASHHSTVGIGSASHIQTTMNNNINASSTASTFSGSGKFLRESLSTVAHGTSDEVLLYSCPGANKTFFDRARLTTAKDKTNIISSSTNTSTNNENSTGGFFGMALSLASSVTGTGSNNAGNGIDKKVSAVQPKTNPSSNTINNSNRSASSSSLSSMNVSNNNANISTPVNQTREKLRESRIQELQHQHNWYWELAQSCVTRSSLCVSSFLGVGDLYANDTSDYINNVPSTGTGHMPNYSFFDATHFTDLAMRTGGKVFLARGSMLTDENVIWMENQLAHELLRGGIMYQGRDVTMKLRLSRHLSIEQFFGGGFFNSLEEEWQIPVVDSTTSAMFSFALTGVLKDEERVYVQLAALYTTPTKERRVRIHNYAMIASEKPSTVYRNSDMDAVICAVTRIAANKALEYSLNENNVGARPYLQAALVDMLVKYRQLCTATSPKGQLVLPESLKVMPMFILGLLKHPAFIENATIIHTNSNASNNVTPRMLSSGQDNLSNIRLLVHATERAWELRRLFTEPIKEIVNSIHPRVINIFAILDYDLSDCTKHSGSLTNGSCSFDAYDESDAFGSEDEEYDHDEDSLDVQGDAVERSPEPQEDRSGWAIARSTSFLQGDNSSNNNMNIVLPAGNAAMKMTSVDMSGMNSGSNTVGLSLSLSSSLVNVVQLNNAATSSNDSTNYVSPPGGYGPPTLPAMAMNNTSGMIVSGVSMCAPPHASPHIPPPTVLPNNLAGYSLAGAVYFDYSGAVSSTQNTIKPTANKRLFQLQRIQKAFRPLRLLRRFGGIQTARRMKLLTLHTLFASSAEFESDQIYVIDDRSVLWLYVGRAVPQELLEEIFLLPTNAVYERPAEVGIRTSTSLGKRIQLFLDLMAADAPYKPEIKVVWTDIMSPAQNRVLQKFSTRLLEDANVGVLSYTDFLCGVHSKIQAKL